MNMLELDIAGVTFAVTLPSPSWRTALAERYADFPGAAPATWQVAVTDDPALAIVDVPWIRHVGPVTTYRFPDHAGQIDLAARRAAISVRTEVRAAVALDRALAYVCLQALPREHDGLLLHAAGIVLDGAGHVFTGASGAGKTTVARLAAGGGCGRGEVLVDENVIVRLGAGGPELCSTPFWGMSTPPELIHRTNRCVPLRGIYLLAHAPNFELTVLPPPEAVVALLLTEKVAAERAESAAAWLAVAEKLIATVPVCRLAFRPTAEIWDFLARS